MKLTFASRIFAGYLLVAGLATWVFHDALIDEIQPVVKQSAEATLIDTANLLAEMVVKDLLSNNDLNDLRLAVENAKDRNISAVVWDHLRTKVLLNFYITDKNGIVIYSSEGLDVGADYSQWRDVFLTLRGEYGARSTRSDPEDSLTSVMHIAAPIIQEGEILGVLTVYSENITMQPFIESSKNSVLKKWLLVFLASALVGLVLSFWLSNSVTKLVKYAQEVKVGAQPTMPNLAGSELKQLANALEEMRQELDGKAYIESYVQSLTHELKSPLAAIKGSVEVLQERPEIHEQEKFIKSISSQTIRIQRTIDQLLRLSALENLSAASTSHVTSLLKIIDAAKTTSLEKAQLKDITLTVSADPGLEVKADEPLLQMAIENLIDNAVDFSSVHSEVCIKAIQKEGCVSITILDQGEGIPDFALDKIKDRFYSLPRPDGKPKSTGLGLSLTQEIVRLHKGILTIENRSDQSGVISSITLFT